MQRASRALAAAVLLAGSAQAALAEAVGGAGYMLGYDGLETLTSGVYAGQGNPNFGRLTLLFNHGNHFHAIGAYSLTGPADAPTVAPTNGNNRLPEISSLQAPLPLTAGTGAYAGKFVSTGNDALEYGDLRVVAYDVLLDAAPGSEEEILANSSGGRYRSSLTGVNVGLQLVSVTDGLRLGSLDTPELFDVGSTIEIGVGAGLDFTPVFWVESGTAAGTYSAALRFVELDANGAALGLGGIFNVDFAAPAPVPVPAAAWLMGSALVPMVLRARRRI